ncbi:MAG: DNA polymerase III subunit beta [Candidatus Komeilibacteria bacterium]|nr:DNA polymerase III subunit beta [Candidatus Komeilibacteria bacterium]
MKIVCTQENINYGLNTVAHLASRNANLPILNNVLIVAENGTISLSTTNLEIGIKTQIRGKIEIEGRYTVPARLLSEFIALLPKENITLELTEDGLSVAGKNSDTLIKGASAEDYPLIPEVGGDATISLAAKELAAVLSQTNFAVSVDESRPEISGVYFSLSKGELRAAATDSYRLAERVVKIDYEKNSKLIVPLKTLQELSRVLATERSEQAQLYINDNQIMFQYDVVKLISRLIEGSYPDYEQIIPTQYKTEIVLKKDDFTNAIKAAALFCKPGINDVKLTFLTEKKELVITSTNTGLGENITTVNAEIKGEDVEIVFNYRYLLDGLNSIQSDRVSVRLSGAGSPGMFLPEGKEGHTYIVMPIRQ